MNDFHKHDGEDKTEYICRICSQKEEIGTWEDVARILNAELNQTHTESTYRKFYRSFCNENDVLKLLDKKPQGQNAIPYEPLELERKKLQTSKLEYSKWLREQARGEMIDEEIKSQIRNLLPLPLPVPRELTEEEARVGILCFGDAHYGTEFIIDSINGLVLNEYNPEIFERRMRDLLSHTVEIIKKEGLSSIKVYSLGDELDGILRVSQLMKLRYGVIEATIKYSEYICGWLTALTQYVNVEFHMVGGNHTELRMLGQQKGTFKDDNLSEIIKEFIKVRLEFNPKFVMKEYRSGVIYDDVCGYKVLGIHGEVKNMETALKDYSAMYGVNVDVLIGAHLHHASHLASGKGKEVIRIPSLMGIDPYAVSIIKGSDAGATFLIFEEGRGKTVEYSIKLD